MSLYPQAASVYGHQYPPQAYMHAPPVAPVGYQYQAPAPAPTPMYYADPSSFRRDYAARLSQLTVNSRPIIQTLSIMAQDFSRYADIVAQCIEVHIRSVPHWMKLPAFYLLDSISKNVFDVYGQRFATFIVSLFLEAYGQVDPPTKSKMEEMLVTWRTGSPHRKELFGVAVQIAIERSIWGNDSSSTATNSARGFSQGSSPPTKSQVLAELEVTLAHKERQLQSTPYETTLQNHVTVLHQLRRLVEAGVSQEELNQILVQLRVLAKEVAATPPPPPPPQARPMMPHPAITYSRPTPPLPQPIAPAPPVAYPLPSSPLSVLDQLSQLIPQQAAPAPTPAPATAAPTNLTSLFDSLKKAGLITSPKSSGPVAGPSTIPEVAKPKPENDLAVEASREYAKRIRSMKMKLTAHDLTKTRPQFIPFLYEYQSLQCKQCGLRFVDGAVGKKKMEEHLDMHFRQNRRAQQHIGRGHSRSWFVGLDSWINDVEDGNNGAGPSGSRLNAKAVAAAELAERESALRASFVVIPPGDEAKQISCPVCKEQIKSEFLEDDEEWVWKNAVLVKEKIYHATCHAELVKSTTLAARMRNECANKISSGTGTPELRNTPPATSTSTTHASTLLLPTSSPLKVRKSKSKSPTPISETINVLAILAGTKRKAADDGVKGALEEHERTPPMKKIAVVS